MQKHLDDLVRQASLAPEWKELLRDLDRLQQVRIHYRAADWLVRTNAAPDVAKLFKCAHVALPSRARQARPRRQPRQNPPENAAADQGVVPRQLEFRRNANTVNCLQNSGVEVGQECGFSPEVSFHTRRRLQHL